MTTQSDADLVHEARILGERPWQNWWPGRAQRALVGLADRLEELITEEWEYGTALLNENGVLWDEEIAPSEQNAREQHAHCRDNPELYAPDQCVMVRRTKAISAGPWEIVPTDERSE